MILFHLQISTMDTLQYWPFAQEYSIWNATCAALQLWTEDLEPHVLSNAIDKEFTQPSYIVTMHNKYKIYQKKYSSVAS